MSQPVDVQITEAEERFLRGFIRRQVLPWFGACVVMALILAAMAFAVATSLATPVLSESSRELGAARALQSSEGGEAVAPADWDAALAQLRQDLEGRLEKSEGGVTKLGSELKGAIDEMKSLRDRVARAERAAKSDGGKSAGSKLASADLTRILKRLEGVETRQSGLERKREKFSQDTLARLLDVEVSRDRAEENRLASDEKARQRLKNLENRLTQIESGALPPASTP